MDCASRGRPAGAAAAVTSSSHPHGVGLRSRGHGAASGRQYPPPQPPGGSIPVIEVRGKDGLPHHVAPVELVHQEPTPGATANPPPRRARHRPRRTRPADKPAPAHTLTGQGGCGPAAAQHRFAVHEPEAARISATPAQTPRPRVPQAAFAQPQAERGLDAESLRISNLPAHNHRRPPPADHLLDVELRPGFGPGSSGSGTLHTSMCGRSPLPSGASSRCRSQCGGLVAVRSISGLWPIGLHARFSHLPFVILVAEGGKRRGRRERHSSAAHAWGMPWIRTRQRATWPRYSVS